MKTVTPASPLPNASAESVLDRFAAIYREELIRARAERPDGYSWPATELETVLARMTNAFRRGSFNKDGIAIRRTCARLGLPHTYKAIAGYLAGGAS